MNGWSNTYLNRLVMPGSLNRLGGIAPIQKLELAA